MNRRMTEEDINEAYAAGMEAAHCGLYRRDGPRAGRRGEVWGKGYRQALRDRDEYPTIEPGPKVITEIR